MCISLMFINLICINTICINLRFINIFLIELQPKLDGNHFGKQMYVIDKDI